MRISDPVECDLCKTKMKVKDIDNHIKNSVNHIGDTFHKCITIPYRKRRTYLLCNYPVEENDRHYFEIDPLDETIYKAE